MAKTRRICVVSSMRNEGAFIIEWLAWYRMLGFTDAIVVTNHCQDHSPELLDCLSGHLRGVHHMRVDPKPGQSIPMVKFDAARGHRVMRWADWVFLCDADEFLVIHKGQGRIEDLVGPAGAAGPGSGAMGYLINWRVFGSAGIAEYHDLPVHQQFLQAVPGTALVNQWAKALFRMPRLFGQFMEHGPWKLDLAAAREVLGDAEPHWRSPSGEVVASLAADSDYPRRAPVRKAAMAVAQVNHYMIRSLESYSLKTGTPSPAGGKDRYNEVYLQRAERGATGEASALRHVEAFEAERARLMALPGVGRLHYLCCADHLRLIAEKHGRDPAADPRIGAYLDRAAAMENGAPEGPDAPQDAG